LEDNHYDYARRHDATVGHYRHAKRYRHGNEHFGHARQAVNFMLALAVIVISGVIFGVVMYIFRDVFDQAALVTTALSTLFGIFGTVVGAYFGIKQSRDAFDKTRKDVSQASDTAKRALAALDPKEVMKIAG
jgi:hypothetical protein